MEKIKQGVGKKLGLKEWDKEVDHAQNKQTNKQTEIGKVREDTYRIRLRHDNHCS